MSQGKAKGGSRAGHAPTQRQLRVGEEIRHLLSALFARAEFRDPDLAGEHVTVAEVRISPDLKNATAFVWVSGTSARCYRCCSAWRHICGANWPSKCGFAWRPT